LHTETETDTEPEAEAQTGSQNESGKVKEKGKEKEQEQEQEQEHDNAKDKKTEIKMVQWSCAVVMCACEHLLCADLVHLCSASLAPKAVNHLAGSKRPMALFLSTTPGDCDGGWAICFSCIFHAMDYAYTKLFLQLWGMQGRPWTRP